MAVKGRKPKPTALKVLEGNPGKRELNKSEVKPVRGALPECPDWLETEAKAEWERLSKIMYELGILTVLDVAPFASYCQAYARWKEAEEFISQHGSIVKTKSGYWQQVPQVSIAHSNQKIMMQAASEFGLTPSARSRMIGGEKKEVVADEMECILSGG